MAEPIKIVREQNLSVTLWENNGHKNVKIQMSYPTKETKDKPKEEREYKKKDLQIGQRQVEVLIRLLEQIKQEEKFN